MYYSTDTYAFGIAQVARVKMLKIWSMKQKQQQAENASAAAGTKKKKVTAAQLRVQKDISELSLPSTMKTEFPDEDDLLNFVLSIEPDEGMYKGGKFFFNFAINQNFPHEPPKVKCTQKIYHPNIDLEGNVCLNILREDWKPVLNLQSIMIGLQFLFLEPNASDPLNKEAAEDLRSNREGFKRNVRAAMGGGLGHLDWIHGIREERYINVYETWAQEDAHSVELHEHSGHNEALIFGGLWKYDKT
ncbi:hypothetical protein DH86_00001546 [Scytalidium sp. 3C]|nr:hypothetical protein DH86_00001546 [Scytalidium sp. 3C]